MWRPRYDFEISSSERHVIISKQYNCSAITIKAITIKDNISLQIALLFHGEIIRVYKIEEKFAGAHAIMYHRKICSACTLRIYFIFGG